MGIKKRVDLLESSQISTLKAAWKAFWKNFTDSELEIMADGARNPSYKALAQKAYRLGYRRLDKLSEKIGLSTDDR